MLSTILGWAICAAVISGIVSWSIACLTLRAARERLQRDFQRQFATEAALNALLRSDGGKMQSFEKIKCHLPGFETDDDLRRHLIRAGAVCFRNAAGEEMWGLLERHHGEAFK